MAAFLAAVLLATFVQILRHVRAFHRGASRGAWSDSMPPRAQHRRVEFLVGRWREPGRGRHEWRVRFWQLCVWWRQASLLVLTHGGSAVLYQIDPIEAPELRGRVVWIVLGLALGVLGVALVAQVCFRPFAQSAENSLEAFLLFSTMLVLVLAGIFDQVYSDVSADEAAALDALEALLLLVLVGTLVAAALVAAWDARRRRHEDIGAMLAEAEARIEGRLRERLADGTIRLLRCAWLISRAESDISLGRDDDGAVIMKRRQDLPEEAFFSPAEAVALLDRADRSILALSYRWLTAAHPDPFGSTLIAVRRFLESDPALSECGLFWECASRGSDRTCKRRPQCHSDADSMARIVRRTASPRCRRRMTTAIAPRRRCGSSSWGCPR